MSSSRKGRGFGLKIVDCLTEKHQTVNGIRCTLLFHGPNRYIALGQCKTTCYETKVQTRPMWQDPVYISKSLPSSLNCTASSSFREEESSYSELGILAQREYQGINAL